MMTLWMRKLRTTSRHTLLSREEQVEAGDEVDKVDKESAEVDASRDQPGSGNVISVSVNTKDMSHAPARAPLTPGTSVPTQTRPR